MTRLLLIAFVLMLPQLRAVAQDGFTDAKRALYIFDICKYIDWANHDELESYTIGVLSKNTGLYNELRKLAEERNIHEKPVRVLLFESIDQLQYVQVVYANNKEGYAIDLILRKATGNNTLVITENYPFHKSMINFLVQDGKRHYEVNDDRLMYEGFSVNPIFKRMGVSSQANWEKLYLETEKALDEEKKLVEEKTRQIKEMDEDIARLKTEMDQLLADVEQKRLERLELVKEIGEKEAQVQKSQRTLAIKEKQLGQKDAQLEVIQDSIMNYTDILREKLVEIQAQDEEIRERDREISQKEQRLNKTLARIKMQETIIWLAGAMVALLIGLGFFIYRSYKVKKQANIQLQAKNEQISKQRDEIAEQKQEIEDSILYARRIQRAVLPHGDLGQNLVDYFILYKPRDIVSGDFYWYHETEDKFIFTAADCTGHGVPGAFMSMLGMSFLNDIVVDENITDADEILNRLRAEVVSALKQTGEAGTAKDGMDMALMVFDKKERTVSFAGANNPLWIVRNGEVIDIKADKMPIAIYEKMDPYEAKATELQEGDMLYVFSDGYADQFGGPKGKKFKTGKMKKLLVEIAGKSTQVQHDLLDKAIMDWMDEGNEHQVDDIVLAGLRVV